MTDDGRYEQCIKAGVLAMYKGLPPAIAVEFARRVLPHDVRPSFEETEKLCRASRTTRAAGSRLSHEGAGAGHHHPQEAWRHMAATTAARGRWPTPTSSPR